ncbi:DUF7527 domain-containing protein [Halorussus aquaticus]|uniref:Transcriptional regulator n=1 Tax=Halorussus aquaticus TaxID=2953748 RepID=A0ABD5PXZ3_9EURY|nr:hypothetical protein [Halorussus aquaticus]
METRTVEQVESWQTRSFDDGFAGLRELSDGEFSGAVRAGGAWLFMLNGRIIGVYEGSLDDFEDADGTAYAAPHPSLPLLFSMQEQGGETQAKYYTNKTPLSEVDSTLTSGNFTGYVELSENVLSGDYYVAYYGGRSMSVAFVGQSEQVVTGDEAFERANDEVGIYEVRDVDVEVTDVPEPDEPDESSGAASAGADTTSGGAGGASDTGTGASGAGTGASGTADEPNVTSVGAGGSSESSTGKGGASGGAGATTGAAGSGAGGVTESDPTNATPADVPSADSGSSPGQRDSAPAETDSGVRQTDPESTVSDAGTSDTRTAEVQTDDSDAMAAEAGAGVTEQSGSETSPDATGESVDARSDSSADAGGPDSTEAPAEGDDDEADGASAFEDEEDWRETTTIPSLDPDRSEGPDDAAGASSETASSADDTASPGRTSSASESPSRTQSGSDDGASATRTSAGGASGASRASSGQSTPTSGSDASGASGREQPADASSETGGESGARVRKLRSQLEQRKQQVEQLKQRLSNVESERNEYKRERDALRQEVERLEAKLETTGGTGSGGTNRQLDRSQAFDGTNLFVRYESKGKATLDEAANDAADASDVNANLRLEHHTQFEADDVDVEGESFEAFLTDSFEYQFVSWVVEELLYEIRDTGHRASLKDLYESIPKIDRVDLHGSVSAGGADDDTRQESFDVIMRDRMGNPLLLADLNGSRDPTTGEMMGSLVDAATGVAQAHDELSGAFQITESFFEPEALETAESATSGGFLSREKRESFVKLSRKRGYHLCLVESRSGGFHLNVPEL